jgi:hypothetical protein
MPYIKEEDRRNFINLTREMHSKMIETPGELNYLITYLTLVFLGQKKESYQGYNDAIGALENAKLEISRRKISKYEDLKIEENGDLPF